MSQKPPDLINRYMNTELSSNMEDYIETIAILSENGRVVRVKDIAKMLGIKMPSVTSALNKLKEIKLIEYEKYGHIELTAEGRYLARGSITATPASPNFPAGDEAGARRCERVACKMEHEISAEACSKLHKFLDFYREEDGKEKEWTKRLRKCMEK